VPTEVSEKQVGAIKDMMVVRNQAVRPKNELMFCYVPLSPGLFLTCRRENINSTGTYLKYIPLINSRYVANKIKQKPLLGG
jgi:hypothetical protein